MNITMFDAVESEPGLETYYSEIPIGAAGAVGSIVRQRGLADVNPVVHGTAGVYTFNLKDGVNAIVGYSFDIQTITGNLATGGSWARITGRTQNSITITVVSAGGTTPADPNNGDIIVATIIGKNTNA